MENLSYKEKVAIVRILMDVMLADGRVDEREEQFIKEVRHSFGLCESEDVKNQSSILALNTVNNMSDDQKLEFAQLMGKMITVDRDVNYYEVELYNKVCDFCHIDDEFSIDDGSDYTFSGPFEDASTHYL